MNKSLLTNIVAAATVAAGYFLDQPIVFSIGLFALSGAFTNWLAIHMLFEKVPGLYGSGVIPARFEAFKGAIRDMMMQEFFTQENIDKFVSGSTGESIKLGPVIAKVDFEPAYESLVSTINESKFGSMLSMFGGSSAIEPLKEPFIDNIKGKLVEIAESPAFHALLQHEMQQSTSGDAVQEKIGAIIDNRLDELTPPKVKEIVENMIHEHLGWLVIWGGVFGGLFGLASALINA